MLFRSDLLLGPPHLHLSHTCSLPSDILPAELYPFHTRVERANIGRLATLPWAVHAFVARDTGTHHRALEQMVVPVRLALNVDAQVILVKNVDERLVNGRVGRVLGCFMLAAYTSDVFASTLQGKEDVKPFVGVASASSKPRFTSNSQEPSACSSSAKANGAILNVHVGADSRTLIALCGRTLADKENACRGDSNPRADGCETSLSEGQSEGRRALPTRRVPNPAGHGDHACHPRQVLRRG